MTAIVPSFASAVTVEALSRSVREEVNAALRQHGDRVNAVLRELSERLDRLERREPGVAGDALQDMLREGENAMLRREVSHLRERVPRLQGQLDRQFALTGDVARTIGVLERAVLALAEENAVLRERLAEADAAPRAQSGAVHSEGR